MACALNKFGSLGCVAGKLAKPMGFERSLDWAPGRHRRSGYELLRGITVLTRSRAVTGTEELEPPSRHANTVHTRFQLLEADGAMRTIAH